MKNVLITGANRGIGLALAQTFSQQGDAVFGVCRKSSEELNHCAQKVIENIDVTVDEDRKRLQSILDKTPIDVLICNAGILRDEQLGDINTATIREQFEVNAIAPLMITEVLLSNLNAGARVAMITSRMGSIADNGSGGRYGYRMSKAALNAAAVSLAQDLKDDNISVGIYHPGYVQTDMVNHGGDITATECAQRLAQLINQQDMSTSGTFLHSNGQTLPW
ncbi:SDR family oxidoreductase [Thalassotalea ganghwensis]